MRAGSKLWGSNPIFSRACSISKRVRPLLPTAGPKGLFSDMAMPVISAVVWAAIPEIFSASGVADIQSAAVAQAMILVSWDM